MHKPQFIQEAKKAALWLKPMQAGTGSSLSRKTYLADLYGQKPDEVAIGSKGTDLHFPLRQGEEEQLISLSEAQILRAYFDIASGQYEEVIFHDLVSNETDSAIQSVWEKPSLVDPKQSYRQLAEQNNGFKYFKATYQYHLPTISEDDKLSYNRTAPGGHGLFAMEAVLAALDSKELPPTSAPVIGIISNGEDLSGRPDAAMVGWMLAEQIPIAMVTTTKTTIDLKGGQIALVEDKESALPYVSMIEKAQAETSGQLALFEALGLRPGDSEAFFNTNIAMFNYEILKPQLTKLVHEIGMDEFLKVIMPSLIENRKQQVDKDGVQRTYTQLEGAMGSVLLNLDRFWRQHYGKALVHIINVDHENRSKFFSPIKTAFDFYMQFYSDRFILDQRSMTLVNRRPDAQPLINLQSKTYADLKTIMTSFAGMKIRDLDELSIHGEVRLPGAVLRGRVKIRNASPKVCDLTTAVELARLRRNNRLVLENIELSIDVQGKITYRPASA